LAKIIKKKETKLTNIKCGKDLHILKSKLKKKGWGSLMWWFMPIIPAAQEDVNNKRAEDTAEMISVYLARTSWVNLQYRKRKKNGGEAHTDLSRYLQKLHS
jgi:hypothetical protein